MPAWPYTQDITGRVIAQPGAAHPGTERTQKLCRKEGQ